jgi:signal recognition particle subunit SRP54
MGDVVSLVEKARETLGERDMKDVAKRMRTGQFDLEDFLTQMQQMKEMGPLNGLLDMLPGGANLSKQLGGASIDDSFFKQSEAIIHSMTFEERRHPDILNGSRRRRIAQGSGVMPADVNRLLNQFRDAKKLMQAMTTGKGAGGLMRMLGL